MYEELNSFQIFLKCEEDAGMKRATCTKGVFVGCAPSMLTFAQPTLRGVRLFSWRFFFGFYFLINNKRDFTYKKLDRSPEREESTESYIGWTPKEKLDIVFSFLAQLATRYKKDPQTEDGSPEILSNTVCYVPYRSPISWRANIKTKLSSKRFLL